MAEDDPNEILAPYESDEQDNIVPSTSLPDSDEPPTQVPVYLYRTNYGTIIQAFSEVEIGTPAWGDDQRDGQIVERVNADETPYGITGNTSSTT
jgi:hypothetical protein